MNVVTRRLQLSKARNIVARCKRNTVRKLDRRFWRALFTKLPGEMKFGYGRVKTSAGATDERDVWTLAMEIWICGASTTCRLQKSEGCHPSAIWKGFPRMSAEF